MSKNNGGPAFPGTKDKWGDPLPGLTIRDYFAAKAMQGIIVAVGECLPKDPHQQVALDAYKFADAMLAEREKDNG
jgi:hypothetical protein